jgi:UDP-glucose 4-epimerase
MSTITKDRIVVTGGAGFIGTNLVEHLVSLGYEVVVVDDLSAGDASRLPTEVLFHHCSITDTEALTRVCGGARAIVHLAALPRVQFSIDEPLAAHAVNVDGTLSVLEAARAAQVPRVVFAASSAAYGDQASMPLVESMSPEPKSPYALHKIIGESYLQLWHQLYGIETVSLRFFNVYGPHLDPDGPYALVIGRFLKLALAGEPLTITGTGEQTRDFIHVHDVVRALAAAVTSTTVGKGEVINIGSGSETSINTLAALIGGEVAYVPARIEPQRTCADIARATRLLNWTPTVTLEDGIGALKRSFGLL